MANLLISITCYKWSLKLHSELLGSLLRARITISERIPLGKFLSRFSSDLTGVESYFVETLKSALASFMRSLTTCLILAMISPESITFIIIFSLFFYHTQVFPYFLTALSPLTHEVKEKTSHFFYN